MVLWLGYGSDILKAVHVLTKLLQSNRKYKSSGNNIFRQKTGNCGSYRNLKAKEGLFLWLWALAGIEAFMITNIYYKFYHIKKRYVCLTFSHPVPTSVFSFDYSYYILLHPGLKEITKEGRTWEMGKNRNTLGILLESHLLAR